MPFDAYVSATMDILTNQPDVAEIVIEEVKPLRTAEQPGSFDAIFSALADMGREHAAQTGE